MKKLIDSFFEECQIPYMYEDELPDDISKETYSWWFDNSIVDGVRIGPRI